MTDDFGFVAGLAWAAVTVLAGFACMLICFQRCTGLRCFHRRVAASVG